jgi:hypothetical protein
LLEDVTRGAASGCCVLCLVSLFFQLYFVFRRVDDAAVFALMLSHVVASVAWDRMGLPASLNIRISLHAAPVHAVVDPGTVLLVSSFPIVCEVGRWFEAVLRQVNYTGVHTSRAARIEPITPPGCVYCSQVAVFWLLLLLSYACRLGFDGCWQSFACISKSLSVTQYECEYVGNVPLAKGYGSQPVYHVRWETNQTPVLPVECCPPKK